ncbi:MAG: phosphatidate cytidylyltransferase [Bacteroidetes bacterium]|nr:phosphatidate cytidylyltransferase [Bacteroidota bacterium]
MSSEHKSNLKTRIMVSVVGIPFLLYSAYLGGILFLLTILTISIFATWEYFDLVKLQGVKIIRATVLIFIIALHLTFFHEKLFGFFIPILNPSGLIPSFSKLQLFLVVLVAAILTLLLQEIILKSKNPSYSNVGVAFVALLWIGLGGGMLVGIRELFGKEFPFWISQKYFNGITSFDDQLISKTYEFGGIMIIGIFITLWICDTAAYFVGKSVGKNKISEISPKKTWEGAIGGFIAAILTSVFIVKPLLPFISVFDSIILGSLIGIFGQMGDFVESKFKRDANVKDSSTLIPGHGGMLDRFDSLLFAAPLLYLYIDFVILS